MYVAVKGGEAAILNSYQLLARQRRGDTAQPELSVAQIRQQLKLAVDRVMTEGSVYDPELAALAIKQAAGDLVEAIFLLRAYRATLPRLGTTCALDTSRMALDRRISATFKDLPGGQVLGPTYDYTQRLLDFKLLAARQVLEGGGDAPVQHHAAGVQRAGGAQARQRGAVGAQQKDSFHQVACCLLDGKGRKLGVVHRSLGHDAVHRQLELLADLRYREFRLCGIAPALAGQQLVAVENGSFSTFDGYVHAQAS